MGEYQYKTPGTPGFLLVKSDNPNEQLSKDEQTLYRSGVGTLLQFSNKTRPEMANAVRELSKGMDQAPPAGIKEMFRVIKYLLNTKSFGLKLAPTPLNDEQSFQLTIYSDSDWASDRNTDSSSSCKTHQFSGSRKVRKRCHSPPLRQSIMQHQRRQKKSSL
jgi:hypothetical protein